MRHMLLLLGLVASGCYSPKVAIDLQDIREYRAAAEQGSPLAQYHLGAAYQSHLRFAEASLWFLRSAKQGVPEAQYAMAENYNNGMGVPKNPVEAYAWYTVAGTQANVPAKNARETIAVTLTLSEVEAGDRRAKELLTLIQPNDLLYGETWTAAEEGKIDSSDIHNYPADGPSSPATMGGRSAGASKGAPDRVSMTKQSAPALMQPAAAPKPAPVAAAAPIPAPAPVPAPAAVPDITPVSTTPAATPATASAPAQSPADPAFQPISP